MTRGALDGIYEAISDLTREASELEARLGDVVSARDQLTQIVEVLGNPYRVVGSTPRPEPPAEPSPAKQKRTYKKRERPERRTGNRPGPVSDKPDYPVIAEYVKELLASSPRAAVGPRIADRFGVPLSTAKNWMSRCRILGLLDVSLTSGPEPKTRPTAEPAPRGGKRKHDLDEVTKLANEAIELGVSMRGAIARQFNISEAHAGSLIQDARRDGKDIPRQAPGTKNGHRSPMAQATPASLDYGNLPAVEFVAAEYLDCLRADKKPIDTMTAKYLCDRAATQARVAAARKLNLLPPVDQPQLPADERRALLDTFKPEPSA